MAPKYKVNVDGAVFAQAQRSRVGAVVRDYDRQVTTTSSKLILQPLGPLEIEAKAMEISVSFAWDVGIRDMVVESDSKIVFDALLGLFTSPITVSNILTSVVHQLQDFRSAEVSHVK